MDNLCIEAVFVDTQCVLRRVPSLYLQGSLAFSSQFLGSRVRDTSCGYVVSDKKGRNAHPCCVGLAASGGAVLLAGGASGKRFSLPHAKVMIHQPYGQVGGQVSDIEIQADEIIKTRAVLNEILASHTGQPIERIAQDTDRDRYLTATEAKDYGLVDDILTKPPGEEEKDVD